MTGLGNRTRRRKVQNTSSSNTANEEGVEVRAVTAVLRVTSAAHRKLAASVQDGGRDFTITASDGSLAVRARLTLEDASATEQRITKDVVINWTTRALRRGKNEIALSRTEMRIMGALLAVPGYPVSRSDISNAIWQRDDSDDGCGRVAIEVYLRSLRKRLRSIGLGSALEAVRGSGYRLIL